MFYIFAKLFWLVFAPANFIAFLVLTAALAWVAGCPAWGRRLLLAAAAVIVLFGVLPTGVWLARPLENAYPLPTLPRHIDGIVMLTGDQHDRIFRQRGIEGTAFSDDRIISAFALARRHPEAKIVYTGTPRQAAVGRYLFAAVGLSAQRLIVDNHSFDTWDNLRNSRTLVRPKPGQVWVLASSASHLPRAMGIARRLGWKMIAYPTDYLTGTSGGATLDIARNLKICDVALHEWIGLVSYRLAGRWSAKLMSPPSP